jgi:hypothetical protein
MLFDLAGRSSNDANWYVINNSTVSGTGTSFLGRPWREYLFTHSGRAHEL